MELNEVCNRENTNDHYRVYSCMFERNSAFANEYADEQDNGRDFETFLVALRN